MAALLELVKRPRSLGYTLNALELVPKSERKWVLEGSSEWDATDKLQEAIESGATIVELVGKGWKISRLLLKDKTSFTLRGRNGARLNVFGTAPRNPDGSYALKQGLQGAGQLEDVGIEGLTIVMSDNPDDGHAGFWSNSGGFFSRLILRKLRTIHGINGISVNANSGGQLDSIEVLDCDIFEPVGTLAGQGYGLHMADGSGEDIRSRVGRCRVIGAHRHAFYNARGIGVEYFDNSVTDHRKGVAVGLFRAAFTVVRSSKITGRGFVFRNCSDGAVYFGKSAVNGDQLALIDARFYQDASANNVPLICVGSIDPAVMDYDSPIQFPQGAPQGAPTNVVIDRPYFEISANDCDAVRVNCARGLKVFDPGGWRRGFNGVAQPIHLMGRGGDAFNDDYLIDANSLDQDRAGASTGNQGRVRFESELIGTTFPIKLRRLAGRADQALVGAAMNNPKISLDGMAPTGNTFASGSYPKGDFTFVHDIPNFDPPSIAINSYITLNIGIPGLKPGDKVELVFLGLGTGNVDISAQCNANNNARSQWTNKSTTQPLDLLPGLLRAYVTAKRD